MGQSNTKHSTTQTLTAIIITKNEETMIANCVAALRFCDEIIVIDSGSTDSTMELAKREGATIVQVTEGTFKDWRNTGLEAASGDWVLYVDADERVTPKLAAEIQESIQFTSMAAFQLKRNNIHFGKWLEHGGWETDVIVRLFKKDHLQGWSGDVHESATVDGVIGQLKEPLVHLSHRSIRDGLLKSHAWIDLEAKLFIQAKAKPVTAWTLVRKFGMEFIRRLILKKGYKDGMEGWIESFQQAVNRFFVYARVWELQQKPSLDEKYTRIEKEIFKLWEKQS